MDSDWQSASLHTTYEEARSVLDAQREVIGDLDAKAMYTVRIVVVVVGVVVAAVRIGGPGVFRPQLLAGGIALLLLSMSLGVLTYSESNLFLGPNRSHIYRVAHGSMESRRGSRPVSHDGGLDRPEPLRPPPERTSVARSTACATRWGRSSGGSRSFITIASRV